MTNPQNLAPITVEFTDSTGCVVHSFPMALTPYRQHFEGIVDIPDELNAPFSVKISSAVRLVDLHHIFVTPLLEGLGQKQWLHLPWLLREDISTHRGIPLICGYNRHGNNRFFLGALEQIADATVGFQLDYPHHAAGVKFAKGIFTYSRSFKHDPKQPLKFFVSNSDEGWDQIVQEYTGWHDDHLETRDINILPPTALDPVWCSWYSSLEGVTAEDIRTELNIIEDLGIKTVIIDEGWAHTTSRTIPDTAGDWIVDVQKFPDMKGLINDIQARGMSVMLWFAPFFIGEKAKKRFELQHLLGVLDGKVLNSLDPRLQETEDHLVAQVTSLMSQFSLDGLKLDFIDPAVEVFSICPTSLDLLPERKYTTESVAEGTAKCLRAMSAAARAVRSDALVEYRQNYSNLATRPFATAFRSQDSPFDPDHIRHMVCLLRLTCPGAAIHADPAVWLEEETDLNVARFLASMCLYSVPFFSMNFRDLPARHHLLIKRWLSFYGEHRNRIHNGRIQMLSDDPRFTSVANVGDDEVFIGLFGMDPPHSIDISSYGIARVWIFNGTSRDRIDVSGNGIIQISTRSLDAENAEVEMSSLPTVLRCGPGSFIAISSVGTETENIFSDASLGR
jgi:alpha-galactosidase